MEITNLNYEKNKLINEVNELFNIIQKETVKIPKLFDDKILLLSNLREKIYENINQYQHKALIIKAIEILNKKHTEIDKWHWHPKQTSSKKEGDITGYCKNKIILNAEVTTSLTPIGRIDTIMKKTLINLSKKEGKKYYIVKSEKMYKRAISKTKSLNIGNIIIINAHNNK